MKEKRNSLLLPIVIVISVLAAVAGLLVLMGPGIGIPESGEFARGYSFIFKNEQSWADGVQSQIGTLIAEFVLMIIAGAFALISLVFSFGKGGKRFCGFLLLVSGILATISAVFVFLAPKMATAEVFPAAGGNGTLGWGFLVAGILNAVVALVGLGFGAINFLKKSK